MADIQETVGQPLVHDPQVPATQIKRKPVPVPGASEDQCKEAAIEPIATPTPLGEPEQSLYETPNWKPWKVHWAYFVTLILIHLAHVCGFVAILSRYEDFEATTMHQRMQSGASRDDSWGPNLFVFGFSNMAAYLAWQFLPVIMAVVMGVLWGLVDDSVRQMEPYYQLSRPQGVRPEETLTTDYATSWIYGIPFRAGKRAQWAVALSALTKILAFSILPALQSGLWQLEWQGDYSYEDIVTVKLEKPVLYASIGVTCFLIVLATVLMVVMTTRRSGMISGPGGLAGLAALICDSDNVLKKFRDLPPCSTGRMISAQLDGNRYWLRHVSVPRGGGTEVAYQIITTPDNGSPARESPTLPSTQSRSGAHPVVLWARSLIAVETLLLGPFVAILVASYSGVQWPPLVFKMLYTFSITIVTSYHELVDQALRMLQPYAPLAKQSNTRRANRTKWAVLQDYVFLSPFTTLVASIKYDAGILASNSFVVFLTYAATIIYPTLMQTVLELMAKQSLGLFDDVEVAPILQQWSTIITWPSYLIGVYKFIHAIAVIKTRRRAFLPRKPDTLATNMMYLAHSPKFLDAVRGTSMMTARERRSTIMALSGLGFEFGWFPVSGKVRLGVEVASVVERYKFPQFRPEGMSV